MDFLADALLLSRVQFALTTAFHILFPPLTIGLAVFLVVLEGLWLKTGDGPPVMVGALPEDGSVRTLPMPAGVTSPGRGELWVTMQPVATAPQPPTQPLFQTRWQVL